MKKTKIICTMGPNENDRELLKKMALSGMDIARFNFSHGDYEEHKYRLDLLKSVRDELGIPIAALLDTKGPEIRTGLVPGDGKVELKEGQTFTLVTDTDVQTDETRTSITYAGLPEDVEPGNMILIDDGLIELRVKNVTQNAEIVCEVENGGSLGSRKGVNVPNVAVRLPNLTDKDKDDILFGVEQGFDFIAASFVRNAACIREIKDLLWSHGADIPVIAKIENSEGIRNMDEIIRVADGVMVARGDMGVEIPSEDVPHIQKELIRRCNKAYKTVITATQMLDSMIRNPRPTRAEVTDVANAIFQGSDCIMLSGETANGKYPLQALQMMNKIALANEQYLPEEAEELMKLHERRGIASAVCAAVVETANNLHAKAIICPSMTGYTVRTISKLRPASLIIGCSPNEEVLRRMQCYWNVKPIRTTQETSTELVVQHAVEVALREGLVEEGDTLIVSAGVAGNNVLKGRTNMMRVVIV